jgi:predicted nucleic acid-binding protein
MPFGSNPYRRFADTPQRAVINVSISEQVSPRAQALTEAGFGALDAAHVACAEAATCDCLLTCDDRLIQAARRVRLAVHVRNPVEYVEEHTHV